MTNLKSFWSWVAFLMLIIRSAFCAGLFCFACLHLAAHDWKEFGRYFLLAMAICPAWDSINNE